MSALRKDERHAAIFPFVFARTGDDFSNKTRQIEYVLSSRNYRFLRERRRHRKIWVTRVNISSAWKFVSGMFVGIVAIMPRAWKREESRFQRLSGDALSNTHLTLWVTEDRNTVSSCGWIYVGICMCFPDSPVIGWPPENLIVRSSITPW